MRAVPLVLVKGKYQNRFLLSFLHYIPYAVLSVMTVPAIFYATGDIWSATAGFAVAVLLSFFGQSLLVVAGRLALRCWRSRVYASLTTT